jgi:hypothetical protein
MTNLIALERATFGWNRYCELSTGLWPPWVNETADHKLGSLALAVERHRCGCASESLPSWRGLSRPSTQRRLSDESHIRFAERKDLQALRFPLLQFSCHQFNVRNAWVAGSSPAMTFPLPPNQQLTL